MKKIISLLLLALLPGTPLFASEDAHAGHHGMHMQHQQKNPENAHSKKGLPIPEPTNADRAAAFPDLGDMDLRETMDTPWLTYSLLDQFEWVDADEGSALKWEAMGWTGTDKQRLWWRSKGERENGKTGSAELQLLYGQPLNRWWDWLAGVRHDFKPSPSQSWLAIGLQGLAPYWFETEASLFIGEAGQTSLRLEVEYELLITQRLVLQPLLELNFYGKDDPERGIGSGLANTEAGLRLRYEIRREIAPYIGLSWERAHGGTADLAHQNGEGTEESAVVAGIRLWY